MGTKKEIFSYFLIYSILILTAFVIYKPAFSSYFFQDDWFTFKISQASSLKEFFQFFVPRTDVIYFRPIGMQVYFFVMNTFFGTNHFFYRLSTLIIYSFNGLLVYLLLMRLKLSKLTSFLGGFLYTGSVATYIPFFWSCTFPFVLGPTFFLLSFLFYTSSRQKILSFIFYLLGLLTLEIVVVLPIIIFIWELLYNKRKTIKLTLLYLIPPILLAYFRFVVFPVPLTQTYKPEVNLLSTVRNYFLWSLNFPEEIGRQMIGPITLNPDFVKDFGEFLNKWIISIALVVFLLIILPLFFKIKESIGRRSVVIDKTDLFGIIWFFLALFPLLIFSNHAFPYYLPTALFGFILFLGNQAHYLFKNIHNILRIILLLIVSVLWLYTSLTTMRFNQLVHWAPRRAKMAQEIINKAKNIIAKESEIIIFVEKNEYALPLNDQDAFEFLFGKKVKTIYKNIDNTEQ